MSGGYGEAGSSLKASPALSVSSICQMTRQCARLFPGSQELPTTEGGAEGEDTAGGGGLGRAAWGWRVSRLSAGAAGTVSRSPARLTCNRLQAQGLGAPPDLRAGAQHPGLASVGGGGSGLQNRVGEQETARLEVALEGWVRGGDRASSPRWADRKMPRSGVLSFNAAPGEETGGGGAVRGGACAGRAEATGQSGRRERAGARGEPREQRDPARGALSGAADRSPQPAGPAARPGPGSGGQDVRAGEYRPPAGTPGLLLPAGPETSRRPLQA